ncbi:MAG TPA: polyphosphate kinase 2 family protein [Thermoanaerobaculia bacterium]|nr:polyphosphate kinase 2 family protein [Thermoanaerobaculia bacterium]
MDRYRVPPDRKVSLRDFDAGDTSLAEGGKKEGEAIVRGLGKRLDELQDLFYASRRQKLLIVLQGMDTSGKDGTIRKVFASMDPLGLRVAAFKAPSEEELDHDFLWRIHRRVPGLGEVVIFNRSHYEDVLVVRVRNLVPEKVWKARYAQINDFERMLAEAGTTIVKFFLHIDQKEQKERLQSRLDDPTKRWKFCRGDLDDRKLWKDYTRAYEDVLSRTSTEWAPWYVVPANKKWYRNVVVSQVLVDMLEGLDLRYPEPEDDLVGLQID